MLPAQLFHRDHAGEICIAWLRDRLGDEFIESAEVLVTRLGVHGTLKSLVQHNPRFCEGLTMDQQSLFVCALHSISRHPARRN